MEAASTCTIIYQMLSSVLERAFDMGRGLETVVFFSGWMKSVRGTGVKGELQAEGDA